MNSKLTPFDPETTPQWHWLAWLLADETGAKSLMRYANGDIRNLAGLDTRDLAGFPNVGEGIAAQMAAFFKLASLLYSDEPRSLPPVDTTG